MANVIKLLLDGDEVLGTIVNSRVRCGVKEYMVKYKNYALLKASWLPRRDLPKSAVKEFEKQQEKKRERKEKREEKKRLAEKLKPQPLIKLTLFERGYEAERVLGVTLDANGNYIYLVQFKGTQETEFFFNYVLHAHCPQELIRFYENHLRLLHY